MWTLDLVKIGTADQEKSALFPIMELGYLDRHWGGAQFLTPTSCHTPKTSSVRITDFSVNGKTKLFENHIGYYLHHLGKDFLNKTEKVLTQRREIDILDHMKIKHFYISKDMNKRRKKKQKKSQRRAMDIYNTYDWQRARIQNT